MADLKTNSTYIATTDSEIDRRKSVLLGFAGLTVIILAMFMFALAAPGNARPTNQTASVASAAPDLFADVTIEGRAAIVVDIHSGKGLYEKNANAQLPIASLTKVALALTVSEVLPSDSVVTIPYDATGAGSIERLHQGERWGVEDVIDFTLMESSNAGANILAALADSAIHVRFPNSPETAATLWRMNNLAQDLGLTGTYFLNVSGLDISTTQAGAYGSARDMAALFAYAAAADPSLFAGTARANMRLTSQNGEQVASALNTNSAQGEIAGLILGKTGITDLAGGNLAVVFDVGFAHPVVVVVLGSSRDGRFTDIETLVSRARATVASQ